ncbi:hypothetical protein BCV70DRAFT_122256 [Testicularia cyperi]|uniref:Ribosomal RNA-processing protein 8 n=1 Tax=Testicularia cyperi TaxID=1882483 RepID=A0A317XNX9_9BASI|nr:hypothetical protein BCV70DRAFT_122256 [Testicularia cyperi]
MSESIDLGQLQAQLELDRSALADSIFSKLPAGFASSSSSGQAQHSTPADATSRPRPANLGVGATPKHAATSAVNGKPKSAADLRLRGQLTAKRKHPDNDYDAQQKGRTADDEDDEEEAGRAAAISAPKRAKSAPNTSVTAPGTSSSKNHKNDPFATKGIEAQKAAQSQPRIVTIEGETVDLSKLSKAQRKKMNRRLREQEGQGEATPAPAGGESSPASAPSSVTTQTTKQAKTTETSPSKTNSSATAAGGSSDKPKLTQLQAQMLSKLSGSRFRTINEKLYTTDSQQAVELIDSAPSTFDEYHQGFREQVRSWPKNPLDRIVEMLDPRLAAAQPASGASGKGKGKSKGDAQAGSLISSVTGKRKARFSPSALVVDLGAGEGGLAKKLVPEGLKVLCFDLITTRDGWVRRQDTAAVGGLPLPGYFDIDEPLHDEPTQGSNNAPGIVDVAVFCLSLMGTNWVQMIVESRRVLREGGELIIAEVSSRFEGGFKAFVSLVEQVGFKLENQDASNTHFVLFEFVRLPPGSHTASSTTTMDELVEQGKKLLKPCLYKRR